MSINCPHWDRPTPQYSAAFGGNLVGRRKYSRALTPHEQIAACVAPRTKLPEVSRG